MKKFWLLLSLAFGLASLPTIRTEPAFASNGKLKNADLPSPADANSLENQLLKEDPVALAKAAREQGDPVRGAIVFYQPNLTCAKCHVNGEKEAPIAPDLARPGQKVTGVYLIESVLKPSKVIEKGFETITVVTRKGTAITGLLVKENGDSFVLRDSAQDFKLITIAKADIEERTISPVSLMPSGLVNQLGTRQEFLDLVRYLMEIAAQGQARARALRPDPALLAPPPLPEYEKHIDHAGMIAGLDAESYRRGQAIYNRLCINCHGTKGHPGSLPTSLRFASGKFKNGSDPYSMYQTLTRGFGMMTPQPWMVPEQKYDVIHYIREACLKKFNPSQYVPITKAYLSRLPRGTSRGPKPSNLEPWATMNYGPTLMATYEVGSDGSNFAFKGIAVRLDPGPGGIAQGRYWMLYDHDTVRVAAAWSGRGFIDWNGVNFNGQHAVHPRIVGHVHFANLTGPGWANPTNGKFDDIRLRGRDGRHYGPLPREWGHYRGLYHCGDRVAISYTVGHTEVLEMPGLANTSPVPVFTRTFNIGPRAMPMILQVAHGPRGKAVLQHLPAAGKSLQMVAVFGRSKSTIHSPGDADVLVAGVAKAPQGAEWLATSGGDLRLRIPAGKEPVKFTLWLAQVDKAAAVQPLISGLAIDRPDIDLTTFTQGGPPRWAGKLPTQAGMGKSDGPFAVDVLTHPVNNPWFCRMRFTGFDFLPDGKRVAICDWDGDVWLVDGIDKPARGLKWQRIASGLFQPLGLKVINGQIYIGCRDQIVILHDLNGDGETDFYENFNNDHQVTEHFHEFAMGLQTDAAGNLYYCKGGRHALPAVVPHHGTLLRVSKDGLHTTIVATGFRAANGVCVNPDGTFFLTDQEGHWTPKNRINWVKEGGFYGYMWGYHNITDPSDSAMKQPVCWITNNFDRSPAEMLWVDSRAWGPLYGALLNLSYGTGKIFIVPHEKVDGDMQGGMCPLPIPLFPTGVMRGRFHPANGQLYCCGMFAWAGNRIQPGGFYRVRYTSKPLWLPLALKAKQRGLEITFSAKLDPKSVRATQNYAVKTWSLKRSAEYGSAHYNERPAHVSGAHLSADGTKVFIEIPKIAPAQCMEIKYFLKGVHGEPVDGVIHNTIHHLGR